MEDGRWFIGLRQNLIFPTRRKAVMKTVSCEMHIVSSACARHCIKSSTIILFFYSACGKFLDSMSRHENELATLVNLRSHKTFNKHKERTNIFQC